MGCFCGNVQDVKNHELRTDPTKQHAAAEQELRNSSKPKNEEENNIELGYSNSKNKEIKPQQQSDKQPQDTNELEKHSDQPKSQEKPKVSQQLKRVLFVGKTGVGKTSLFNQLSTRSEITKSNTPFQEEIISQYSYIAVDTPAFQMDDSIEEREKTISLFQEYIEKHKKTITTFAIVVNFERTDLMKKKISDVYKYLHKFKEMIAIIIFDWQLSDDQDRDKEHLEKQFKLYNQCKLCFVEKKQDQETLKLEISKIVFDIRETPIDLEGTIFEKNQSLDRSMEIKLQNLTNQIR